MRTGDLSFLYGESVPRCTHQIDKVFEDYCTLQFMTGGAVELAVGDAEYVLRGRWFWSAFPGPRISFHAAAGTRTWRHRYIAFRGELVNHWLEQGLFPIKPQRPPAGVADFDQRFDALLPYATRGDQLAVLQATHLLEGILLQLAEVRGQRGEKPPWLETALAKLDEAAAGEAIDYAKVAEEVGMAERTFRRRFGEAMGVGPHEYVLQVKIAEARRLLGETDVPLKLIAGKLGYRDVYFFSRQFRQLAGVPPASYRRSRQR